MYSHIPSKMLLIAPSMMRADYELRAIFDNNRESIEKYEKYPQRLVFKDGSTLQAVSVQHIWKMRLDIDQIFLTIDTKFSPEIYIRVKDLVYRSCVPEKWKISILEDC